jgi:hypothetical protein
MAAAAVPPSEAPPLPPPPSPAAAGPNAAAAETATYQTLLRNLETDLVRKEDAYQELMKMESNVLQVLDRVAASQQAQRRAETQFLQASLPRLLELFATTWRLILHELVYARPRTADGYLALFFGGDRTIVMGMTLVAIAVLLIFLEISS